MNAAIDDFGAIREAVQQLSNKKHDFAHVSNRFDVKGRLEIRCKRCGKRRDVCGLTEAPWFTECFGVVS